MSLGIEWLAAALAPADVAPHPNFFSQELVSEASVFALICAGRWSDIPRAREGAGDINFEAIDLALAALTTEASPGGPAKLRDYVRASIATQVVAPGKAVALGLLAAQTLCEADIYEDALDLLMQVSVSLEGDSSGTSRLLDAAIRQQIAIRYDDLGLDDEARAWAQSALNILIGVDAAEVESFALSKRASWSSETTIEDVRYALEGAARSLLASLAPMMDDSWEWLVRARPSYVRTRILQTTDEGYGALVDDLFEAQTPSGSVVFGAKASADSSLFAALIVEEFLGAPSVRAARKDLGKTRFLQAVTSGEPWLFGEALTLLRHGRDFNRLRQVVRYVHSSGPLAVLTENARQVLRRMPPVPFAVGELVVVSAAADVLSPLEAVDAFGRLLDDLPNGDSITTSDLARVEELLGGLAALANVAEPRQEFLGMMKTFVTVLPAHELLDRIVARAFGMYDWSRASEREKADWAEWLADDTELPQLRSVVAFELDSGVMPGAMVGDPADLQSVAVLIDRYLRHGHEFPANRAATASRILSDQLRQTRAQAARASFSGFSINTSAAAVVVARLFDDRALWAELATNLADPQVARSDTRGGFSFLLSDPSTVPEDVRTQLRATTDEVLYGTQDPWQEAVVAPYPEALQAFIALGLIDVGASISAISRLAGAATEAARIAACGALATYVRHVDRESEWATVLALQLTSDRAAQVRSRAGRILATLLQPDGFLGDRVLARIDDLLGEDGVAVPGNLLHELQNASAALSAETLRRVGQLAEGSSSATIRRLASRLL